MLVMILVSEIEREMERKFETLHGNSLDLYMPTYRLYSRRQPQTLGVGSLGGGDKQSGEQLQTLSRGNSANNIPTTLCRSVHVVLAYYSKDVAISP